MKKAYEDRQPKLVEFEALSKVKNEETRNKLLDKIGTFDFMGMVQRALEEEAEAAFLESLKNIPQLSDATVLSAVDTWNSSKYKRLKSIKVPADGVIDENFLASLPTVPDRQRRHYIHYYFLHALYASAAIVVFHGVRYASKDSALHNQHYLFVRAAIIAINKILATLVIFLA